MRIITVLWEDQRAPAREFGPGELLTACVADVVGTSPFALRGRLLHVPKKGNGNVVAALRRDHELLARRGPVIAVFDRDKSRELFEEDGPARGCATEFIERLRRRVAESVSAVLLEENVESIVKACLTVEGATRQFGKPSPDERDRILNRMAFGRSKEDREEVRRCMPTFGRLVRVTQSLLERM